MVDTIKFSEMTDGGDIDNNKKVPGLKAGGNVLFNNPWTFLPPGTTAQRPTPSAEVNFRLRFNTDDQLYEYYDSVLGMWTQLQESAFTQGPFLIYEADPSIPDGQNLGALADGILKQTIILGVATLDIAVNGVDYWAPGDELTRTQAPVVGDDVTNKTYVDSLVSGGVLSVQGTANQVLVNGTSGSPEVGALVLTTPQDIASTSSPSFAGLTMSGDIDLTNTSRAINALDPINPQDYATKFYVDQTTLSGTSVYAASAATLGTVTQSGSGVGATLTNAGLQAVFSIDGVSPPVGTNVLIKNTATGMTAANEGIYTVTDAGSIITNWVLTRAISYDTPSEINNTGLIVVRNGSTLTGTLWYNSTTIVTVDTTSFSYAQYGAQFALKGANADITSMTGLTGTLQAPTGITDSSGNLLIAFNYQGSPATYIDIKNSPTQPAISSLGTPGSIPLAISVKNSFIEIYDNTTTLGGTLRFSNALRTFYTELKVAAAQATSLALTLPAVDGSANYPMLTSGAGVLSFGILPIAGGGTGVVVSDPVIQRVSVQTGALGTGATALPVDDTIPQNGEGNQYMTLSITPKNVNNILKIDVVLFGANAAANNTNCAALFQDSTANALACGAMTQGTGGFVNAIKFTHIMTAGTTSSTTFNVRAGGQSTTGFTFNGSGGGRFYGGVFASSINITEYST